MANHDIEKKDKLRKRFGEIFKGADIEGHPLYQSLIKDLGSRTFPSIMADLEEAAVHQRNETSPQAPGWRDEQLSA